MIAISYRREDSTPIAGRLHDRLRAEFGKDNVFMDFDSIPYGVDFREHITRTLEEADILIAVIGPGWLGDRGESNRRIDDVTDFVRLEIAGALQRGIPVIPILVDKTPMPREDALPSDLKPLVFRNALMLDTGIDFHHHVDRLIAGVRGLLKSIQSASRRSSKERIGGSPRSSLTLLDPEHKPTASGRFKWLGVLDRLISPALSQRQEQEREVKPISQSSAAELVTAVPKERSTPRTAPKPKRTNRPKKQIAPPIEKPAVEPVPPVSVPVVLVQKKSIEPPPPDIESVPLASVPVVPIQEKSIECPPPTLEPVPPVSVPVVPLQEKSIGSSPPPLVVAADSGAVKKPQRSVFTVKLGLILAFGLITVVTYFALTSKRKLVSTNPDAIAASPFPSAAVQSTAADTSVVNSSAFQTDQPSRSHSSIETTTSAVVASSPSPTPSPIVTEPSGSNYQVSKSASSADEESVRQLVRDYYAALFRHDLDAVVSKFADSVDYQGQGRHDKNYIRNDVANYFRRWDKIVFDPADINVSRTSDGSFVASFNFPFAVAKGPSPEKTGLSSDVWILREGTSGNLQIVSQREKVTAGRVKQRKPRH